MDTPDLGHANEQVSAGARRAANRRAVVVCAVMLVLWLTAILFRNEIRAHWWVWQLARADADAERVGYFLKLASLGDRAVPAVLPLLDDADPGLRSIAVAVLHHAPGTEALSGLARASEDADADVRRSAMRGLALRPEEEAGALLRRRLATGDERTAMMAAHALGASRWDKARQTLIATVNAHPHVGARAEAIQVLAEMRAREAVPVLIQALRDRSVFEGVTEADIQMIAAFEAVAPQLASREGLPEVPVVQVERRHVVADCAMDALVAITNRPDIDGDWRDESPELVVRDWLAWWAAQEENP
jgi:HEAT repeat protein